MMRVNIIIKTMNTRKSPPPPKKTKTYQEDNHKEKSHFHINVLPRDFFKLQQKNLNEQKFAE